MKLRELQELLADAAPPGAAGRQQPWLEAGSPRGGVAWTPLQLACATGDAQLVAELLAQSEEEDASASSKTAFGYSPLHIAAHFGQLEIAKMLLSASPPADVDALDAQVGCSPLHVAVLQGDVAMARVLLDVGRASQAPTKDGTTPLELLDFGQEQRASPHQSELRQLLVDRSARRRAREQLSGWLAAVGMVEYAPQFVAQGFDDPAFLLARGPEALRDGELDALGVAKPGHRSKLRALFGLREFLEALEGQSGQGESESGSGSDGEAASTSGDDASESDSGEDDD